MRFLLALICVAVALLKNPSYALAQERGAEVEALKKAIDRLQKEIDLLKRENATLKKENATLRKGNSAATEAKTDAVTRVTVDDVEYVYQGTSRHGNTVLVTVLATSKNGNKDGPAGSMTLIDEQGVKYVGKPSGFFGRPVLREGIPLKLTWEFGTPNPFTAKSTAPSTKITRYAGVIIEPVAAGGFGLSSIDFRNVPAGASKAR